MTPWVLRPALSLVEGEGSAAEAAVPALKHISDGNHGRCTQCSEWIPRGRLEAVLAAAPCITSQEELEAESA